MTYQAPPRQASNGMGISALILGIIGVLLAWIPFIGFFGFILGTLALIFGIIGIVKAHKGTATNKAVAYVGASLGAIAFIVSIVVFGGVMGAVDEELNSPSDNTTGGSQGQSTGNTVKYEVEGTGTAGSISYGQDGGVSQDNGADLPWSVEEEFDGFTIFSMNAQNQGGGEITCRITAGGEVIDENTSSGEFAVVSCNGRAGL